MGRSVNNRGMNNRPMSVIETRGRSQEAKGKDPFPISGSPTAQRRAIVALFEHERHDSQSMPPPRSRRRQLENVDTTKSKVSLSTTMAGLNLHSTLSMSHSSARSSISSPSRLPRPATPKCSDPSEPPIPIPAPFPFLPKLNNSPSKKHKQYLTKYSNLEAWDVNENVSNIEAMYQKVCEVAEESMRNGSNMKTLIASHTATISSLEQQKQALTDTNVTLRIEKENAKSTIALLESSNAELKERYAKEATDLKERLAKETAELKERLNKEIAELKERLAIQASDFKERQAKDLQSKEEQWVLKSEQKIIALEQAHREREQILKHQIEQQEKDTEQRLAQERGKTAELLSQASTSTEFLRKQQQEIIDQKNQELEQVKFRISNLETELKRERQARDEEQKTLSYQLDTEKQSKSELHKALSTTITHLELANSSLQAKVQYLESDQREQSESYAAMEKERDDAIHRASVESGKSRKLETQRRQLHDMVQNLKGNIRVICRHRPALPSDGSSPELAVVEYPDFEEMKTIAVRGPEERSSLGTSTTKTYPFTFDKAFTPTSSNSEIFEEIEPLIQSAIDGYNVCIFAYGQTGSGKTHTMSSQDGVMPRAIQKIYDHTKQLEEMGWKYNIQGSFVEVYNENINDLLGDPNEIDKKKHEIRHDTKNLDTTVTDVTVVDLDSQETVARTVEEAMSRRSVAATRLNERSSRSHSVFILKLSGMNSITGESSKGTLNLVDLAGSERVSRSKVEGDRLKETQNINKSLSCLKDVIAALGAKEQGSHIPYRNSKLTYLLQYSLGGNSKTLMFVMVSPLKEHLGESLSSLKFATQVHSTHIGTAKRVK